MSDDDRITPLPDGDEDPSSPAVAAPPTADDEALRATVRDLPEVRSGLRARRPRVQPSRGVIAGLAVGLLGAVAIAPIEHRALGAGADLGAIWAAWSLILALGAAIGCVLALAEWLVARLRSRPLATAAVRATCCLPVLIPVARHLFDGAFASTLPGASTAFVWVPLFGWLGLTLAFWPGGRWLQYPRPDTVGRAPPKGAALPVFIRRRRLIAAVLGLGAVACEYVNRSFLRSEYPDLHTMLVVGAVAAAGLSLWLGFTRPWRYDQVERRAPVAQGRALALAGLISAVMAVVANLVACVQLGLRDPDTRFVVATQGMHTRLLARVVRALVDADGDGHSPALGGADCDDTDPQVHPEAREIIGNDVDEDCDGYVAREDLAAALAQADEVAARKQGQWRDEPEVREFLRRTAPMHVVLLSIDALRADVLADSPENRAEYPRLFQLFADSTVFTRAFAPSAGTDLSLSGILTGRIDPFTHVEKTLAESLHDAGRVAHGVIPSEVLRYAGKTLLTRGLHSHDRLVNDAGQRDVGSYSTSARTTGLGLAFLDQRKQAAEQGAPAPFFLWLHYFDVHEHDEVDGGDRSLRRVLGNPNPRLGRREKYRAMLRLVDEQIGVLVDELVTRQLWDKTLVVLVSDHGEGLGEDPRLPDNHGRVLYNPLIHVPLAIRIPGEPGRLATDPVSILDVTPTLLDLLAAEPLAGLDGRSLLPHLVPGAPDELRPRGRPLILNESDQYGVIAWPYKLLVRPGDNLTELYDLSGDFGERNNLAESAPRRVGELMQYYHAAPHVDLDRTSRGRRLRERNAATPGEQ
ncbi:sulfatase-like hydrolase/transferase [Nannocystis punicea]|uniref:Sulfatase-like hydrolase/transferase n=1 Tax=Nannocystis punicea TaxID=2995304 RepID=A0ABY7HKL0_9BACT|nr:sulfatase-like hydrolase/transferase [Nannocystis poenicansa]WAS99439.1 sulfatase-like hydrolase/transferase [Nannocystis poenicansa]